VDDTSKHQIDAKQQDDAAYEPPNVEDLESAIGPVATVPGIIGSPGRI
jgi:hypothetical protein